MTITRAEAFPAGEFLADELDARGWTQAEFAEVLGRPPQFVSEIISGKKEITRESAAQIGAALGTSAEMWLNLQNAFYLWRQRQDSRAQNSLDEVRTRARMRELAPISTLVKRGFITSCSLSDQAEQLRLLYRMESLEDEPSLQLAARRVNQDEKLSPTQLAWVACVQSLAEKRTSVDYSHTRLLDLATRLSQEAKDPETFKTLPALFSECGVILVYVEAFASSKIDGCSLMVNEKPVIGLSGRGKRLDKVLFTLLHEIAHITRGDLDGSGLIVDDPDGPHTLGIEEAANHLARTWILPASLPPIPARIGGKWVTAVAQQMNVNPIVIIGQLQHLHALDWRTALVKGAPTVDRQLSSW
ncbi:addiction module antidote protein, HigA family [Arthrobacter echini]|uniref:Addiction module antidote protein, HigA family n=1 Tax=Arthrobacter echini TaxID=1529066 RepID=A0A4S5E0B4_9MICC|nr:HigA family addiction module antitoxin [Arthrobacter echini]THJ64731.1 addiction module antidote protein, HigA family [Arthrobacter echini]